jgi:chromosome segregation ATPase
VNNEEKILSLLEKMTTDVSELKQDVSGLKQDVSGLKQDVSELKQDVSELKQDVSGLKQEIAKTNMIIETQIQKDIRILAEGHRGLVDRLWNVPDEIDEIKDSVSILKFVQTEMAKKVNK